MDGFYSYFLLKGNNGTRIEDSFIIWGSGIVGGGHNPPL